MSFKKNIAVTGFTFGLVSATDGSDITTGTPVGYYTLDGGTQTAIGDVTPVHEGNGLWSFDLTAAEMNGDVVALTFTHTSAISAHFTIKTVTVLPSDLNDFDPTTDEVDADIVKISGSTAAADNLEASALGIHSTEVTGTPSSTTLNLLSGSTVSDIYNGRVIVLTSGTNAGLAMTITDYDGASKLCTYDATITVANGDNLVIV